MQLPWLWGRELHERGMPWHVAACPARGGSSRECRGAPLDRERREWLCSSVVELELLGVHKRSDQPAPPECSVAQVPKGSGVSAVVGSKSLKSAQPLV